MPTTRRRRRQGRRELLTPALQHFLEWGEYLNPDEHPEDALPLFALRRTPNAFRVKWQEYRDEVLGDFIREHPGQRPHAWWQLEAPEERRRRLGGIGTPSHEVLAYMPHFKFGIPVSWVQPWSVDYYNGRARDVHGKPIGTEYREGYFQGQAIDPDDPPRFESQAAYLDRHGLLTAEERAALPADAFEPEVVTFNRNHTESE